MQKVFQTVAFALGVAAFVVGIIALFKGIGAGAGGSFKLDDIVEFKGDSTAIVFVFIGAFLMAATAGWLRNKQKAESEQAKKVAVARDLRRYVQASKPLANFTAVQPQALHPDLWEAMKVYPSTISAESQAVLQELEKNGA